MEDKQALCSVIIPAYNCSATITATVESALRQTYSHMEVLIVNDASTDDTLRVLADLAKQDARIQVFNLETNGGVANARNYLFAKAKGSLLALLDSDDIWEETKLEEQITLLRKSGADLVYSSYGYIDGKDKPIGVPKIVPEVCSLTTLLKENYILPSTVVMKTSWVQKHSMDGSYAHEDFVFWLELLQNGLVAVGNQKVLIQYRIYENNLSGNKWKAAKNRWIVYRRFLKFNVVASAWYFSQYTINGIKKYKGIELHSSV